MDRQQERLIEWACQKLMRRYYFHVDRYEYEAAAALLTDDARWNVLGVELEGREQILAGMCAGLQESTIRHVLANEVVKVTDADHAEIWWYLSIYFSPRARLDNWDGALPFDGPNRVSDQYAALVRTPDGWQISQRKARVIFRSKAEPLPIETWADKEGLRKVQKP